MATCARCSKDFDVDDARSQYNSEFGGDPDYDSEFGGEVCEDCAISDTSSNINLGTAIQMVNGDVDYDDDFVQQYL